MKLVGSGLGNDVDDISAGPAVLGGEGVGLDLELLNVLDGGHVDDSPPVLRGVPGSVEEVGGGSEVSATEVEEGDVLVRLSGDAVGVNHLGLLGVVDGGVEGGEAEDVAEVEREFDDLLLGDVSGDVGVVGVDERSFAGDDNILGGATGRKERGGDRGERERAGHLDGEVVVGRGEEGESVVSGVGGGEGAGDSLFDGDEGDPGVGNDRSGGIGDGSIEGCGEGLGLREERVRSQEKCDDDGHHSRYGLQSCVTDGRPIDCLHSLASLKNGDTGECAQPCFQSSIPDWPESETTLEGRRKDCPGNYPNVCRCLGD